MAFSPLSASADITEKYKRYLKTIFQIKDKDYAEQFDKELDKENLFAKGPYLDVLDSFVKGHSPRQLIEAGVLPQNFSKLGFPMDRTLYFHQEEAIKKSLLGNNIVVSTGTGSGKTESFLFPILAELSKEEMDGTLGPGVRALIIYPMNALANDQMERLRTILDNYPEITYGSYTGQTKKDYSKALTEYRILNNRRTPKKNELICRDDMINTPPNILITNYAMLEYLMIRPTENTFFEGPYACHWKYIVMDEAHVYSGSTGIEVSMLLRRLRSTLGMQSGDIRYILTSATLGDAGQNAEVAKFAESLCASQFLAENVIRATRQNLDEVHILCENRDITCYYELALAISDEMDSKIEIILQKYGVKTSENLRSDVFDYVIKDKNYWKIRQLLLSKPRTVNEIAAECSSTGQEIADFVTVAAYAVKGDTRLFDAKYHMFIKACDSAFIILGKSKKLILTRSNSIFDKGEEFTCFEISVCTSCHAIYLVGKITPLGYLKQTSLSDDSSMKEVFFLGDKISDEDEEFSMEKENMKAQSYKLCPHCGKLMRKGSSTSHKEMCEHDSSEYVNVIKITRKDGPLRKCVACENMNRNGILRPFFAGQEAVTSVIGTALFEELPSYKVIKEQISIDNNEFSFDDSDTENFEIEKKKEIAKQFIAFSDSRQAAAFYASYLNQTYTSILYKRLIVETLKHRIFSGNVDQFVGELQAQFEKYHVIKDKTLTIEKEAWKAVLSEMVDCYAGNALQNLGFFSFSVDPKLVPGFSKANLSKEDMTNIINVCVSTMFMDAAISYSVPLNQVDKEFFTYNGHEGSFTLSDNTSKRVSTFLPVKENGLNKRVDYVEKVFAEKMPGKNRNYAINFLKSVWNGILIKNKILSNTGVEFKVDTRNIQIYSYSSFYYCPVCNKVTPYNVANVCPTFKCSGNLEPIDLKKNIQSNHYYRMYQDMEIRSLRAVEHTAQLDKEKAYEYQNLFKNKEIDVLSCSTTFEMGVDVGSLETVFMRNMPPSPANYAQRAGRAGRSTKSVAYALTFCNKGNHDFAYFNNPEAMIRGNIKPPVFKVENDKIAIRHIFASTFGMFWRRYSEYFADTETLLEHKIGTSGYEMMQKYLNEKPKNLSAFLKAFLPDSLVKKFDIDDFGWTDRFIGKNGTFTIAKQEYEYEIDILEKSLTQVIEQGVGSYDYLKRRLNNYRSEGVIPFLSKRNVLPKYGFPVDTVELSVYDSKNSGKLNLDLSRDLSMAISEYAPGSQIVADGNLITSQYIKTMPKKDWKRYDYTYCTCNTLNIEPHMDYEDSKHLTSCKVCGKSLDKEAKSTFIVPEFGFEAGKVEKATLIKPRRTYNSEVAYVGYKNTVEFKAYKKQNRKFEIAFSQGDEMAVVNRSNFFVCELCGYTQLMENCYQFFYQKEHKRSNGTNCSNKSLRKFSLGYKFEADVIQIRFCWPQISRYEQAISILYGIMRGTCAYLDIEESDIAGTIQYFNNNDTISGSYSIILYDKIPGGAGHVKRLYDEEVFEHVLKETLRLMRSCTCGGDRKDTSCYSCLRSYNNQRVHDYLQRRYVIDFLEEFFNDNLTAPVMVTDNSIFEQNDLDSCLKRLLHMYGPIIYEQKRFSLILKSALSMFPKQAELLLAVYNTEIADAIWEAEKITKEFVETYIQKTIKSSDLTHEQAEEAVNMWVNALAGYVMGKEIER